MTWIDDLDPKRAIANLLQEKTGDWYRDPWNWPEYSFLLSSHGLDLIRSRMASNSLVSSPAKIEVPKENFGVRPAVILSIGDRVIYQTLVDRLSSTLIGDLMADVYGWRMPPGKKRNGRYARQSAQWIQYRSKLSNMADIFDFGLKADISSFFASIDPEHVVSNVARRPVDTQTAERLFRMLRGWRVHDSKSGLPQRSTASAILANMLLVDSDAVLRSTATPTPKLLNSPGDRFSFARWMDDMWIFGNDDGKLRSGQVDLQSSLANHGLALNSGKTHLLSGPELAETTKKIRSSAIDDALPDDPTPLEELVDQVFEELELVDRSIVRFISRRMRKHNISYRVDDLLDVAVRLPHAADHLGRLFRRRVPSSEVQDWLLDYVAGPWSRFEWSIAQFATATRTRRAPRSAVIDLFADFLGQEGVSVPLVAVAAQRLSVWDPDLALDLIGARVPSEASPQVARVLSLAGLNAGAAPKVVRRWLALHDENYLTLLTLEDRSFASPTVSRDYS